MHAVLHYFSYLSTDETSMEREREPQLPDEDHDQGPQAGEAIDEVPGASNEELEQAHEDDAARERKAETKQEE